MSRRERERLRVLVRVRRGELNLKDAAELSGVCVREPVKDKAARKIQVMPDKNFILMTESSA